MRKSSVLCVGLVLGSASAFGQTVFIVRQGGDPTLLQQPPITAKGGEVLTLEAWVKNVPDPPRLREFQVSMPCTASGGTSGSIDYPAAILGVFPSAPDNNNNTDPNFVFFNKFMATIAQFSGGCSSSDPYFFPLAKRGVAAGNGVAVPLATPKKMATFTYTVFASTTTQGSFTLAPAPFIACGDKAGTFLKRDTDGLCFANVQLVGVTINVPTGRCCKNLGCTLDCQAPVTQYACGGAFTAGGNCSGTPPCPCQTGSNCSDGLASTADTCSNGTCSNPGINVVYGDINPCGGDGIVNALDLAVMVNIMKGFNSGCSVCNGIVGCAVLPPGCVPPPAAETAAAAAANGPVTESAPTSSSARITLRTDEAVDERGTLFQVDVYARDVVNLSSYHIGVEATGGRSGHLDLESISVDRQRPDYVFAEQESFMVLVDKTRKTLDVIHLDGEVTAAGPVYLGTFGFRPSAEARGKFQVDLQPQDGATLMMSRHNTVVLERSTGAAVLIR